MNDKTKIILIYSTVAFISFLTIFGFLLLRDLKGMKNQSSASSGNEIAENIGKQKVEEILRLERDLTLTNQDGEEVSIYDLKDKVWVFTQFFVKCPRCAERNYNDLLTIYKKYKDHPDFMIVCMSIDPETDTPERLKEYANIVNADTDNWWFLTGDKKEMYEYMSQEIKFLDIRERTDPAEIAAQGQYAHDLGMAVFDKGLIMRAKKDLAFARDQKNKVMEELFTKEIYSAIETALKK